MNTSHDRKLSSLVAPMMLFMVMCATRPAVAEQPLTIDVSPCVNIRSAIERLTCYDELAYQAQQTQSDLEAPDLGEPASDSGSDAQVTVVEPESVAPAAVTQSAPVKEQVPVTEQTVSDAPVTAVEQESVAPATVIQSTPVKEQDPVTEQMVNEAGRVTEENFGFPPEKQEDEEDFVELHSTISKLKEYVPGRYLITLENGQVWRQMVGEQYRLRVGYNVRIYPSRWGESFRLSAEGLKGFIQVERVR